jgi:hypothetical protein
MTAKPKIADRDQEADRKRDDALRRALAMPPKKHKSEDAQHKSDRRDKRGDQRKVREL